MKKRIILLFVVFLQTVLVSAQTKSNGINDKKFSVGIRGGLTVSNILNMGDIMASDFFYESLSVDDKAKFGAEAGFVFNYRIKSWFYLQPGIYYTMQGAKYRKFAPGLLRMFKDDIQLLDVSYRQKITLHYFKVPLLLSFRLNLQKVQLQLNTGPYIAVAAGGRVNTDISSLGAVNPLTGALSGMKMAYSGSDAMFGTDSDARRFDTGWNLGLALNVKNFVIGADCSIGYLSLLRDRDNLIGGSKGYYNAAIAATLGYDF